MSKAGRVYYKNRLAGIISEGPDGYSFKYDDKYLFSSSSVPLSINLPMRRETYRSISLFPFFDGLIPEECLLDVTEIDWRIIPRDRMELLLTFCSDAGNIVRVKRIAEDTL